MSTSSNNSYCGHFKRKDCHRGKDCKFVHTHLEYVIWTMESRFATRAALVNYCNTIAPDSRLTKAGVLHCPFCSLNFRLKDDYLKHCSSKLHQLMMKSRQKDLVWEHRKCMSNVVSLCNSSPNCRQGNLCSGAHSDEELKEWKKRAELSRLKMNFTLEEPSTPYMEQLRKRIQKQEMKELNKGSNEQNKVLKMQEKFGHWNLHLAPIYATFLKYMAFLQPDFSLKYSADAEYCESLAINDVHRRDMLFDISFQNPGIFGQCNGTLIFDFGEDESLFFLNFTVIVSNLDPGELPKSECVEDWSVNRVIIDYPVKYSGEPSFETKVKKLENVYKIPRSEKLDNVYLKSLSPSDYATKMHNFLYKEEAARQAVLSRLNLECSVKINNQLNFRDGPMLMANGDGSLFGSFSSPMRLSGDSDEGILVRDGCTMVLIGTKNSTFAYECKIRHWEVNDVHVTLPSRCVKELNLKPTEERNMMIQFKLDRSSFCQRHYAVDELGDRVALICPQKKTYALMNYASQSVPSTNLDEAQNKVLQHMHAVKVEKSSKQKSFPPLVIAGPFGTGKTHTIRHVILDILEQNGTDSRILLCTHSNGAADLYIKDTANDPRWIKWKNKILRVMYHERLPSTVLVEEVLNFCLLKRDVTGSWRFRYPTIEEVMKYRIVITTFPVALALSNLGAGMSSGAFTHIFLDEASQAMEPEVIMPLTLASLKNTRVVMAGDHRQINERMFLTENCQVPTLLERMYEAYEDVDPGCRLILNNNYRCVDGLLQLISKLFYKKDILKKKGAVKCINGVEPVHFIHVQGECKMTERGEFINMSEVEQILLKVQELIHLEEPVEPADIVVTAPYYQQVALIRDIMRKNGLRNVSVQTARNLQALQYKVVIMSSVLRRVTCLSCIGENFGFLSDPNLLNTVLTRAKSLVITVGDAITLCSTGQCTKKWKAYIKHCEESGTIHPYHINIESIQRETRLAELKLRAAAPEFFPSSHRVREGSRSFNPERILLHQPEVTLEEIGKEVVDEMMDHSSEDDDADSWTSDVSDISDTILDDMVKKATGYDPNKLRVDIDEEGRETINYAPDSGSEDEEDPNEVHNRPSKKYSREKPIFPKHSIAELEQMLEQDPNKYKKCRIHIKNWYTAEAVPLSLDHIGQAVRHDDDTLGTDNRVIHLNTKKNLGRTFDRDEVVVKIIDNGNNHAEDQDAQQFGQVVGVLKRYRNPKRRHFLCRPDVNCSIMAPVDKNATKFAIITPRNHSKIHPPTIPIYKVNCKKGQYTKLDLIRCEKVSEKNAYAVKYLKWAEYCPYPLGFVEKSVPLEDYNQCLSIEFGVSDVHKPYLIKQAEKLKVPSSSSEEVIPVFTIDPEGSKDLDDALSIEACDVHKDCSVVGVHITDVASVLPKDSPVDKAARKQGSSFYKGTPCHMLPAELSTKKCSILANEIRPAISTFFHTSLPPPHIAALDVENSVVDPQKTFIRSEKQFTYREAEDMLRSVIHNGEQNGLESLQTKLYKIWHILWEWRVARIDGAAFYKDCDNYSELLTEGRAHLLVEEAMLAVNANTAKYLVSKGFNIHLRTQEAPVLERWKRWEISKRSLIEKSCYLSSNVNYLKRLEERRRHFTRNVVAVDENRLAVPNYVCPDRDTQIFSAFWQDLRECWEKGEIDIFLFLACYDDLHPSQIPLLQQYRSMQKKSDWLCLASRKVEKLSHFSLRLPMYTKSSSPLRRYPDLVIQRCLHRALKNLPPTDSMSQEMQKLEWDIEDRARNFERRFQIAEMAKNLREQPEVYVACVSQITDAYLKISVPSLGRCISPGAKQLDYAFIMADVSTKFDENDEDRRTNGEDLILEKVGIVWKFRYYNYQLYLQQTKISKKVDHQKFDPLVVSVPSENWKKLISIVQNPPRQTDSDWEKEKFKNDLKNAFDQLTTKQVVSQRSDEMTCETKNNPFTIFHHRAIRKTIHPGTSALVQLSSWCGRDRLPEPAVQLLAVAADLDVCVQHQREPLQVFANDAKTIKGDDIRDMNKYQRVWEPLIRLNAAYTTVKEGSSVTIEGVEILWKIKSEQNIGSPDNCENSFVLKRAFCKERYLDFHRNDLLCLRLKEVPKLPGEKQKTGLLENGHSTYTAVLHGYVSFVKAGKQRRKKTDNVEVRFRLFDQIKDMNNVGHIVKKENLWTVELLALDYMHRHMQENLSLLHKAKRLVKNICLRTIHPTRVQVPKEGLLLVKRDQIQGFPYPLNENQQNQKEHAVQHDFSVIQGPPGTGKSVMGAQIAATFAYINRMKNYDHPCKVLYCGPSNKSVDVAAGFLKSIGQLKVIRMYSTKLEEKLFPNPIKPSVVFPSPDEDGKMPDDDLASITLHNLIRRKSNPYSEKIKQFDSQVKNPQNKFTRKELDAYTAIVKDAKKHELEHCDIIVCTCSLSSLLSDLFEKQPLKFAQCIIDECGMCTEPETMLPLVVSNPDQVVLIGDHKQLQPVIKCKRAERMGLGTSLFFKYSNQAGMLTEQYRMHPVIMGFPSREFYEGKLVCADVIKNRPTKWFFPELPSDQAVFWDVRGEEKVQHFKSIHGGEKSKYNMMEAKCVIKLLIHLTNNSPTRLKPADIMVLSPYTAQCARIREMIVKSHNQLKDVHVGTVVTSQGSEANYVILSTVRSLPDAAIGDNAYLVWQRKNLGFVCDPHQVNVALTRARYGLCIIGNKNLLQTDRLWKKIVESYQERDAMISNLL